MGYPATIATGLGRRLRRGRESVQEGTALVMHVASVGLQVFHNKRTEALSAIDELIRRMRSSPGCLDCRLLTSANDDNSLTFVSEWESRQAVDDFLASREFLILQGMRMLLREEPKMVLDGVSVRARLPASNEA